MVLGWSLLSISLDKGCCRHFWNSFVSPSVHQLGSFHLFLSVDFASIASLCLTCHGTWCYLVFQVIRDGKHLLFGEVHLQWQQNCGNERTWAPHHHSLGHSSQKCIAERQEALTKVNFSLSVSQFKFFYCLVMSGKMLLRKTVVTLCLT